MYVCDACMHVCDACMCVCMHLYVSHVCVRVRAFVYTCVCVHFFLCMCTMSKSYVAYAYVYLYMFMCIRICTMGTCKFEASCACGDNYYENVCPYVSVFRA